MNLYKVLVDDQEFFQIAENMNTAVCNAAMNNDEWPIPVLGKIDGVEYRLPEKLYINVIGNNLLVSDKILDDADWHVEYDFDLDVNDSKKGKRA
jgi:hypothetical protein